MQGPLVTQKINTLPTPTIDDAGREIFVTADGKKYYSDGTTWNEYALQDYVVNKQTYKNKIINGDFQWWQRGTSFPASADSPYTADRWKCNTRTGCSRSTVTIPSEQGFTYSAQFTTENSSYNLIFYQGLPLGSTGSAGEYAIGTTWTLSGWAMCNESGRDLSVNIRFADSASGTSNLVPLSTGVSLIPSTVASQWTYFSHTFYINDPPNGTNICMQIMPYILADGLTAPLLYITGWQLEKGNVATPFEFIDKSLSRLIVCRYFNRIKPMGEGYGYLYGVTSITGSTVVFGPSGSFPCPMRATPSASISTAPSYANCTNTDIQCNEYGFTHRLNVASTGYYRAHAGIYDFDAEI
jgi:hypothetical protein